MKLIRCSFEAHAEAILAIFNDAILTSTALYEYEPRDLARMRSWFAAKTEGKFPVIGYIDDSGALLGFASYGTFRAFPAYKYTVEHSVYVERQHRGKGLGRLLLREIQKEAEAQGLHMMIGAIDADNAGSIRLHASEGFKLCGRVEHAGFKFGRWLDFVFYQKILTTPADARDG